ncbi:YjjG family noncanonical pyrimidine nucleotidase [Roseivirga sp.]|uniref:YjjG family noncanonical pyrimidine nucleotidase n=1 Tax=Roseivirga sp. TaxID=1964215 RepID=UPI003B8BA51C
MSKYKHIFFDLDHTLWDYDANATEALGDLYDQYNFQRLELFDKTDLAKIFFEVNYGLWDLYNIGKIQRPDIRALRFKTIFEKLGAKASDMPKNIEEEYIQLAPTKEKVFDHAHLVLDYLAEKYQLHVITNGFDDIQSTKMNSSDLRKYFDVVVTSETTAYRKPNKEIFELAMNLAKAPLEQSIMIGDNLDSDIAGAKNVGMDYVWFNPEQQQTNSTIQHEIQNLIELKSIL